MRSVLKTCQLELKAKGPVFVGSGYEIQKKEYIEGLCNQLEQSLIAN